MLCYLHLRKPGRCMWQERGGVQNGITKANLVHSLRFDRGALAHHDLSSAKPRRRKDGHHGSRSSNGAAFTCGKAKLDALLLCLHPNLLNPALNLVLNWNVPSPISIRVISLLYKPGSMWWKHPVGLFFSMTWCPLDILTNTDAAQY